jgi:LPS export ABC transporter permease LptG/LPS export ABC transporter permease LptF
MLKTLDRYLIREVIPPTLLSLLIFTFVLDIPPLMNQLQALVAKGVSWGIASKMLLMLVPQALGLTIPMSLLVGILIALGRMSGDREAVALLACGVSPYRLLRPLVILSAAFGAVHLWVMISAIPDANQAFRQLSYDVVSQQVENDIRPQVFFTNFPGWVIYVRDIPKTGGGWKDVMIADTSKADAPILYMASRGRLVLDRDKQTVALILQDGTQYSSRAADGKEIQTYRFPNDLIVKLDPQSVFPHFELMRGINELSVGQLREQAADKLAHHIAAHQEVMAIQQKFSFPVACLVFAIIALALGLSVARDGKLAGFVVGIAVIFGYYILLYLAEAVTKGFYAGDAGADRTLLVAHLSRWFPNLLLLPFGIMALIWRARWAEGRIPFRSVVRLTGAATAWIDRRRAAANATPTVRPGAGGAPRTGVVVVIRVPRLSWLLPNILDRYIARIYVRAAALSFMALLGIFYISTFIDRSDKLFKGQATTATLMRLLAYMTPQFVYYVIPLAALLSVLVTFGLLSRTSELSVMKACGISLYRIAAPLLLLGFAWSGVLYGLEQDIMARANQKADTLDSEIRGRPPRTSNPLNRQWVMARDGAVYHYAFFDSRRKSLQNLVVYRPSKTAWQLESETYTPSALFADGRWTAVNGWAQDFSAPTKRWAPFAKRALPLETPDYFETEQPIEEMMTVPQLKNFIDEQARSGFNVVPQTVELQKKLAFPFVTVVMTLLAIPFGVTTGKRGTLYGIGIGIVLALAYWITGSAFAAVGEAGLMGPILAAWAPNVLAAGSAGYLLLTART